MNQKDENEHILKFLLVGDSGSGKTSLLLRYSEDKFLDHQLASIGIDFRIKRVELNDLKFKLQLWDTGGQERFRTITPAYYRNSSGILLACDMSKEDSLKNMENWLKQIKDNVDSPCIILVGTKNDLDSKIPIDVMKVFANEKDIPFVSTSSKTGDGVSEAFMRLLKEVIILSKVDFGQKKEIKPVVIDIANQNKKSSCC